MNDDIIARNLAVAHDHITNEGIDPASVMHLYTDDIILEVPGRGLRFDTHEAIEANYRRMFASFADVEIIPLDRFATETRVFDDMIVRLRLVGDGMVNAPVPVGSHVEMRLLHVFHMRDGKIAREIVHEQWTLLG
ncbi:nuclear transport factor 2 family protein [Sphingopyxis sp. BSN-002]|uniref:nuclear transport factor 2 family protein n=1 Tax=Sphingopyxis sp. BSN-002 TaxID=2911495 RepID=UPI001EDC5A3A|nr:nuclear transport factor 2 family protein [Sphingopyxis sp. BSN-002]UKK83994.1 nuclear transport factor 2 family protein [Sphingopyxis sp. BSN-002]